MAATYRLNLTFRAADDLQEAFEFIERNSPQNATEMIIRLLDAIDRLDQFPHRYKIATNAEVVGAEVRSMPVKPYLVHGARQPEE